MASIHKITNQSDGGRVSVVRDLGITSIGGQVYYKDDLNPSIAKFNEFWDLMEVIKTNGYMRASMSVIGRSAVGTDWTIVKHPEYKKTSPSLHKRRLYEFYTGVNSKAWDNIRDYYNIEFNLMIGVQYLRYFGQVAYGIIRDAETGKAVGMYHLPGLVVPNVDSNGYFKSDEPAFIQYPTNNPRDKVDFNDPLDVVFITTPAWDGNPMGGTDIESLTRFTLPLDLYLQTGAREYMKNRDKPEVIYQVAQDLSDEAFDTFRRQMEAVQRGASNLGKNPLIMQGDLKVHEMRDLPESLPYHEARDDVMEEQMAVSGVGAIKLGITKGMTRGDMREYRREFHETTMQPVFKILEVGYYEQIHVREFRIKGWSFKFDNPDFLTAVEKATVDMRYYGMNVKNPNEIRTDLGEEERTDEFGDMYADQLQMYLDEQQNQDQLEPTGGEPGSPPEGREDEPDAPGEIGEPTIDDQDPPRGDQHDDESRAMVGEFQTWKKFAINRFGKHGRKFNAEVIPATVAGVVQNSLDGITTVGDVEDIFNSAILAVGDVYE